MDSYVNAQQQFYAQARREQFADAVARDLIANGLPIRILRESGFVRLIGIPHRVHAIGFNSPRIVGISSATVG